jgi:hypothetical protein
LQTKKKKERKNEPGQCCNSIQERLRQEDLKFKANLGYTGYMVRLTLKKKKGLSWVWWWNMPIILAPGRKR